MVYCGFLKLRTGEQCTQSRGSQDTLVTVLYHGNAVNIQGIFFSFNEIRSLFHIVKEETHIKKGKKIQWYWELFCLFYINNFCKHIEGGRLGVIFVLGRLERCLLWIWFCGVFLIVLIAHRELLKNLWNPINNWIAAGQSSGVSSVTCSQNGTWHWLD